MDTQHLKFSFFLAEGEDFKPRLCVGVAQGGLTDVGTRVAAAAQGHLLQPQPGSHCGMWLHFQGQGYQSHLQELPVLWAMGEE